MQTTLTIPKESLLKQALSQRVVRLFALLIVCMAFLYALVGAALTSPFSFVDDHEVVEYLMHPITLVSQLHTALAINLRFYPLHSVIRYLEFNIFAANPLPWHVLVFMVGVATLMLIYTLLRRFVPPIYAVVGILLLVCYPSAGAIWYRLSTAETIGMFLTVAALTALANRHDTLFVVLALLAAMMKESFVFLIPAMLALYVISRRKIISPQSVALILFGAVFAAVLLMLKLGAPTSFGAVVTGSLGTRSLPNVKELLFPVAGATPLLLAIPFASQREKRCVPLVFALWVIPQVILYSSGLEEHYLWPAILAPALITPLAVYRLQRSKFVFRVAAVLLLLFTPFDIDTVVSQRSGAEAFLSDSTQFQEQMQQIARENPPIVSFDYPNSEQIELRYSTRWFLAWYGYNGKIDFGCTDGPYCTN